MPPFRNRGKGGAVNNPVIPSNSSQLFDTAIFNAQIPREGPKALGVVAPFDGTITAFDIQSLLTQSQQFMSIIQAFFCDNSGNSADVTLTVDVLNQFVKIPANSQAYLPLLFPKNANITVSSSGVYNVQFIFLNVPVAAAVWKTI